MRLLKDKSFKYGVNDFSVEAKTEEILDRLIAKLNDAGWREEWTQLGEEGDYGWHTSYAVDCSSAEDFRLAFKEAKAAVSAELKTEAQGK